MKKTGWIATAAAGVVLVGGGAWAATAIASDEPAAQPEIVTTPGGEPNSVPIESTTPEATPTVTPTPEATYSEEEMIFLEWARPNLQVHANAAPELANMSDDEMLATLAAACEAVAAHEPGDPYVEVVPGMPEMDELGNILDESPEAYATNNVNLLFVSAARDGYSTNGTTLNESYCD